VICYHGTPMSGDVTNAVKCLANRDAMVSFAHPNQLKIAAEVCRSVVLDNGAYSAFVKGEPITDWTKFYDWVDLWQRHPSVDWAVIPDVIEGSDTENEKLLDEWPFGEFFGVPVFHIQQSLGRLKKLMDRYPRIGLGNGGVTVASQKWWALIGNILNYICDDEGKPQVKIHGLKMMDPTLLAHIPFSSVDSTTLGRNLLRDQLWKGPFSPSSPLARATIIMDRLENHAKASRWSGTTGNQLNFELLDCNDREEI
jgi:hypothetical protein